MAAAQLARRPDGRARGAGVELATFPGCRDGDHELFPRADCRDGRSSRLPRSRPTAPSANRRDDCVDIAPDGVDASAQSFGASRIPFGSRDKSISLFLSLSGYLLGWEYFEVVA